MNTPRQELEARVARAVTGLFLPAPPAPYVRPCPDPRHGDLQTNVALVLGKTSGRNPREIAEQLRAAIELEGIAGPAEIAGPGFLNFRLHDRLSGPAGPGAGGGPAARRPHGGEAGDGGGRLQQPEHRQGNARRASAQHDPGRRPGADLFLPGAQRRGGQSHRRLGHRLRHDPARLQARGQRGEITARSVRPSRGDLSQDPGGGEERRHGARGGQARTRPAAAGRRAESPAVGTVSPLFDRGTGDHLPAARRAVRPHARRKFLQPPARRRGEGTRREGHRPAQRGRDRDFFRWQGRPEGGSVPRFSQGARRDGRPVRRQPAAHSEIGRRLQLRDDRPGDGALPAPAFPRASGALCRGQPAADAFPAALRGGAALGLR